MELSVVATLFKSETHVADFCDRVGAAARKLTGNDYEIVLVNDGSPDSSLELAMAIAEQDEHFVVVDLSRNFGHHRAMMTGLDYTKGRRVFLIDSDLEEDPDWLIEFSDEMKTGSCDVVYGVQETRRGSWLERSSARGFYWLFKVLTGLHVSENMVTARLMNRRYVDALLLHREREIFIAGLWHITGFVQRARAISKSSTSKTTYTFRKKMSLLVNSVTSFSDAPLAGVFYLGASISALALGYVLYLVARWAFFPKPLDGWTSIMASIWLLGGLGIASIGVVGIYLAKVYSETKQRPYTIVRAVYSRNAPEALRTVERDVSSERPLDEYH